MMVIHPGVVLAATTTGDFQASRSTTLSNPVEAYNHLGSLISIVFTILILAGVVTSIGVFIMGAIQYGTAGDGPGAAKARQTMTAAVIGLILLGMVFAFMQFYNHILPSTGT